MPHSPRLISFLSRHIQILDTLFSSSIERERNSYEEQSIPALTAEDSGAAYYSRSRFHFRCSRAIHSHAFHHFSSKRNALSAGRQDGRGNCAFCHVECGNKGRRVLRGPGDQRSFPETPGREAKYDHTISSPLLCCGSVLTHNNTRR